MLASIALIICMASDPGRCEERFPVVIPLSWIGCQTDGQQIALEYLAENPGWTLRGWRCTPRPQTAKRG